MDPSRSSFVATSTTVVVGVEPGLYKMAAAVVPAMPMVFVDHKPSGVGVIVSPKGYVLVPDSLITDADDIGVFINGQLLPASLVGVDSGTGLAVVRVHSIEALTSASFVSDTSVGFGSFVAVIWVDGTGTHSCWGTVSDLDVKLSSSDDSPPLLESLETLDPTVGVATGGVIVDGTGHLVGMITGAGKPPVTKVLFKWKRLDSNTQSYQSQPIQTTIKSDATPPESPKLSNSSSYFRNKTHSKGRK